MQGGLFRRKIASEEEDLLKLVEEKKLRKKVHFLQLIKFFSTTINSNIFK